MDHSRQVEPGPLHLFGRVGRGNDHRVDLPEAVRHPRKGLARHAGHELDPRPGGLQKAMRVAERQPRSVADKPGLEEVNARVMDLAGRVECRQDFDRVDRPLPGGQAEFHDLAGLLASNLAVHEPVRRRLGKVQKIKQPKTTQTSHSGLPADFFGP